MSDPLGSRSHFWISKTLWCLSQTGYVASPAQVEGCCKLDQVLARCRYVHNIFLLEVLLLCLAYPVTLPGFLKNLFFDARFRYNKEGLPEGWKLGRLRRVNESIMWYWSKKSQWQIPPNYNFSLIEGLTLDCEPYSGFFGNWCVFASILHYTLFAGFCQGNPRAGASPRSNEKSKERRIRHFGYPSFLAA